ncbi:MAG: preprotein translocase subunit SecY ['Candidatus Kapabacteria' thiocyanatum]|uniref:Protein translocase subunit SecY n=1 Tax=Candidatus Kapaibacterium thiocyanatum TaxID=1895771 RepID=A0A1M3KWQ6_9BACT|nr:preprotein translocase subunit SecY ['Candidatus Kapabacteria' thiocyanatum]OJX56704.1 MAG: preprotein translocase subunit SecY ['Candidatus Kapabacteria' thiocyanatum]
MSNIVTTLRNIFRIEELRTRIIFTLVVLLAVRIGSFITIPGVDVDLLSSASSLGDSGTIFGLYDMFVGGAFSNAALFALGIMPYISASIILQIAGVVLPSLQKMQREGEDGRRKINQYTRYLTVFVAVLQAYGVTLKIAQTTAGPGGLSVVPDAGFLWTASSVIILTAGTIVLMWLGEQITDRGIGNGISLIIFIGIIARFPTAIQQEISLISAGSRNVVVDLVLVALLAGIIAAVILVTQGARRIPVQYAKRVVGRKVYGGTTQYIPLRVNTAGVMPIIFAQSILFVPATIASFFPESTGLQEFARLFSDQSVVYAIVYGLMILFFTYFYTAIAFNPKEVADNMKRNGGFVPGVRPGQPTSDYIENILTRITLPGAVFLALIAILPTFAIRVLQVPPLFASFFGGTSLLIIVGVALDTLQQIESYLLMRHYDGFMKTGKIRGRAGAMS